MEYEKPEYDDVFTPSPAVWLLSAMHVSLIYIVMLLRI